jgi:hypothetical protein
MAFLMAAAAVSRLRDNAPAESLTSDDEGHEVLAELRTQVWDRMD